MLNASTKTFTFKIKPGVVNEYANVLFYAGAGGSTAGKSVRYNKVSVVSGRKPLEAWVASATDLVNNIQIGGANLLTNTKLDKRADWDINISATFEEYQGYKCLTISKNSNGIYKTGTSGKGLPTEAIGKTITASVDVYATATGNVILGSQGSSNLIPVTEDMLNRWVRVSKTMTVVEGTIVCYSGFGTSKVGYKNLKIEYGNKATDWTANPKDLEPVHYEGDTEPSNPKNGDTWTNNKGVTQTYYDGWVITGDMTGTVIDGGLVTTGTLAVGGGTTDPTKAVAGITGVNPTTSTPLSGCCMMEACLPLKLQLQGT